MVFSQEAKSQKSDSETFSRSSELEVCVEAKKEARCGEEGGGRTTMRNDSENVNLKC